MIRKSLGTLNKRRLWTSWSGTTAGQTWKNGYETTDEPVMPANAIRLQGTRNMPSSYHSKFHHDLKNRSLWILLQISLQSKAINNAGLLLTGSRRWYISFPLKIGRQRSWHWSLPGMFGDYMDYQRILFRIEIRYAGVNSGVRSWGCWKSSWTNCQHTIHKLMVKQNKSTKFWNTTYVRTICGTRMTGLTYYPL